MMDQSRRSVEIYWRAKMIDNVTTNEDKVAAVYRLEEICQLLRTSSTGIVKEVADYILKRLNHKSPIVKQKTLRLIKYAVGKSGVEFRREMQRGSAAIRQLFQYKGQMDPLKGDSLNKAVRDTAHEAVTAIFSSEEAKPPVNDDINRRIQGFGNTNYEPPSEDKKSFLSEVVGLGSASIRQGLNTIAAAHSSIKNDGGSYRGPNLRRSLTTERDFADKYEPVDYQKETPGSSSALRVSSGKWGAEYRTPMSETSNVDVGESQSAVKSREEKLLDTIVTTGGVRLQPTRDAIQLFLKEAAKLDAEPLCYAIEAKLQSHLWQVRIKAACVLEAIIRKQDVECFENVFSYFRENTDAIIKCSECPQNSVREKATKVLELLGGDQEEGKRFAVEQSNDKDNVQATELPDLIDTGDFSHDATAEPSRPVDPGTSKRASASSVDSLFEDDLVSGISSRPSEVDDPFADVSFLPNRVESNENDNNLFSGSIIGNNLSSNEVNVSENKAGPGSFDIFSDSFRDSEDSLAKGKDLNDLMSGLSVSEPNGDQQHKEISNGTFPVAASSSNNGHAYHGPSNASTPMLDPQVIGTNQSGLLSSGPVYNLPSNSMFNQAFVSQQLSYGSRANLIAQQQLLAAMSGNHGSYGNVGFVSNHVGSGGQISPLPDIFQLQSAPVQSNGSMKSSSKKDESKAFDFISDHISSVRDPKRV